MRPCARSMNSGRGWKPYARSISRGFRIPDRAVLLQLVGRFDQVWHHPAADHRLRKRQFLLDLIEAQPACSSSVTSRALADGLVELEVAHQLK